LDAALERYMQSGGFKQTEPWWQVPFPSPWSQAGHLFLFLRNGASGGNDGVCLRSFKDSELIHTWHAAGEGLPWQLSAALSNGGEHAGL
jgi:hypothetical protein